MGINPRASVKQQNILETAGEEEDDFMEFQNNQNGRMSEAANLRETSINSSFKDNLRRPTFTKSTQEEHDEMLKKGRDLPKDHVFLKSA
jgi:hypothetical protein